MSLRVNKIFYQLIIVTHISTQMKLDKYLGKNS